MGLLIECTRTAVFFFSTVSEKPQKNQNKKKRASTVERVY